MFENTVISARAVDTVQDEEASSSSKDKPAPDPAGRVRTAMETILDSQEDLYYYTTPQERAKIRQATCPPRATIERSLQANPLASFATSSLFAIGVGVLLGTLASSMLPSAATTRTGRMRGILSAPLASASSATQRTVDRMLSYA